ncbi:MAG: MFS transporter [Anaerolineales bacterium]|nr:MFS transporter [Anaerolineales bacterium]
MEKSLQENALQKEFVPLSSRIWISAADASTAILNGLVTSSAMKYYFTELRGLSLQLEGIVWLLFAIWNAVNDPLFGYISDRTKSKLGRRIPYIRYGVPILVLGFASFWIDFGSNSQAALFIQMLLALFVFDTLYTAIATSLYIMPYEIAISNKARSGIYIWKIIFMVFTIVVPLAIEATIKPAKGDLPAIRFFEYFLIGFGVLMGLIIFFSTFFYKERHQIEEQKFNFVRSFKECFANRSFVVFEVISFTVIFVQTALMQGLWKYFDEINVSRLAVIAPLGVGILLGVVLWIRQRDRWGIKLSTQLFSLFFAIGCFIMLLGGKTVPGAAAASFLFGVGFAGGMYLIPLMNGDVVDMDEHRTGMRREGMYAGINSFITKPAISLAQWAMSTLMLAYGYDQTLPAGEQSASAETGILMGWVLWPGILLFISFLSLYLYPLAGKEWNQIKEKLAERHQEAEKKFLAEHGIKYE